MACSRPGAAAPRMAISWRLVLSPPSLCSRRSSFERPRDRSALDANVAEVFARGRQRPGRTVLRNFFDEADFVCRRNQNLAEARRRIGTIRNAIENPALAFRLAFISPGLTVGEKQREQVRRIG